MVESEPTPPPPKGERIAKVLARAGLCSRREAERWIADGRVAVGGTILTTPAVTVLPGDDIIVDGAPIAAAPPVQIWRYHKPAGMMTTHNDPQGRPTVFDNLPDRIPRVISIGRLDFNSEGLLLLTNDGELARHLEKPDTAWVRRYRVRVHGRVNEDQLATLADGVVVDGERYRGVRATLDRQQGGNAWITMSLTEGRNREIRRLMDYLGWPVNRLIRIAYGPFQLGNLARGEVEAVPGKVMRDQLGKFIADRRRKS